MLGKSKQYIKSFTEIKEKDTEVVGEKGVLISKLYKEKVPIPNGFVATSFAFDDFLVYNHLVEPIVRILSEVKPFVHESAKIASEKIANIVLTAEIPPQFRDELTQKYLALAGKKGAPFVSVEISNVIDEKFVPIHNTIPRYLDIRGIDSIEEKIKMIWLSIFTTEAIELRTNNYYKDELTAAAIIKRMVMSELSGKIYSIPPTTRVKNHMEIHAYYGIENTDEEVQMNADIYTLEDKTKKIIEKKIIPQKKMLVRKGNGAGGEDPHTSITISKEWQRKPKLQDDKIKELAKRFLKIEKLFGEPIELNWGIQAGEWFVTNVGSMRHMFEDTTKLETFPEKGVAHTPAKKQEKGTSKKKKYDLNEIEKEIEQTLLHGESIREKLEQGHIQEQIEKMHKEIEFPTRNVQKEKTDSLANWSRELNLHTKVYLDITRLSSTEIESVDHFDGTFFDGTDLVLKNDKLAEHAAENEADFFKLVSSYTIDLSIAAQSSSPKPFLYQASGLTSFEYKLLKVEDKKKHAGDERFIENPEALIAEITAFKQGLETIQSKPNTLILPKVRSLKNLDDLLKISRREGIRPAGTVRTYAEVSIPSFANEIGDIEDGKLQGIVVDYDMLLKLSLFRDEVRDVDHEIQKKTLFTLSKIARQKRMHYGIRLQTINETVLDTCLRTKPDFLIFDYVPEKKLVEYIAEIEKDMR